MSEVTAQSAAAGEQQSQRGKGKRRGRGRGGATSFYSQGGSGGRRSSPGRGRGRGKGRARGGRFGPPIISMQPFDPLLVFVYSDDNQTLEANGTSNTFSRTCGPVRSAYFRDHQPFGYLKFTSATGKEKALKAETVELDGRLVHVLDCKKVVPGSDLRVSEIPSSSLVLKNLAYNLPQEQLAAHLKTLPADPEALTYHKDEKGSFTGIAFVRYASVEDSSVAFEALSGMHINERQVFIEYKRKSKRELMLEEPEAVELDAKMQALQDDESRQEEKLEQSLSRQMRKVLQILCEKHCLYAEAYGEGSDRYVMLSKVPLPKEVVEVKSWDRSARGREVTMRGRGRGRESSERRGRGGRGRGGRLEGVGRSKVPSIQPTRQPEAPDGTIGFSAEYQIRRKPELAEKFAAEEAARQVEEQRKKEEESLKEAETVKSAQEEALAKVYAMQQAAANEYAAAMAKAQAAANEYAAAQAAASQLEYAVALDPPQ